MPTRGRSVIASPLAIQSRPTLAIRRANIGYGGRMHVLVLRVLMLVLPMPIERATWDTVESPSFRVLHKHVDEDVITGPDARLWGIAPSMPPECLVNHGMTGGEGLTLPCGGFDVYPVEAQRGLATIPLPMALLQASRKESIIARELEDKIGLG